MSEALVAGVQGQGLTQEGGQVLVCDDVLEDRDVKSPGALEHVLVTPCWMLLLDPRGQHIVPSVEEDGEGEKRGVLIDPEVTSSHQCSLNVTLSSPRVTQDVHTAGVCRPLDVRRGEVVHGDTLSVVRRIQTRRHLEAPVLEGPHGGDPGLGRGVDEAAIYPGGDLVFLKWSG